ncbi:hypothetical protein NXV85_23370 [Bacteroides fragilis]|nr:hypothetical protein [Bacteroides fragilis]
MNHCGTKVMPPANPGVYCNIEYMADANNYDWTRYTYFIPKLSSQYDGYCSYEPMLDPIDAYWDVDGKTMRNDITMEQRERTLCRKYGKISKI